MKAIARMLQIDRDNDGEVNLTSEVRDALELASTKKGMSSRGVIGEPIEDTPQSLFRLCGNLDALNSLDMIYSSDSVIPLSPKWVIFTRAGRCEHRGERIDSTEACL